MNPSDELLASLRQWMADERVDSAAKTRAELRWQHQIAGEELDFGTAIDQLSSSAAEVLVATASGQKHRGAIALAGEDFFALTTRDGLVALTHRFVSSIELELPWRNLAVLPSVQPRNQPTLGEMLSRAAEDRPHVRVITAGSVEVRSGELVSVGEDVVVLSQIGFGRRTLLIPFSQMSEMTFT